MGTVSGAKGIMMMWPSTRSILLRAKTLSKLVLSESQVEIEIQFLWWRGNTSPVTLDFIIIILYPINTHFNIQNSFLGNIKQNFWPVWNKQMVNEGGRMEIEVLMEFLHFLPVHQENSLLQHHKQLFDELARRTYSSHTILLLNSKSCIFTYTLYKPLKK